MFLTKIFKRRWSQGYQWWLSSQLLQYFIDGGGDVVSVHCFEDLQQRTGEGGLVPSDVMFYQQKAQISTYPHFWKTFQCRKRGTFNFPKQFIWEFPKHYIYVQDKVFLHFGCSIWNWRLKKYPQNISSPLSVWLHNKYTVTMCSVINEHQWIAQFNCLNFLIKIRGNESIHYVIMLLPIMTNRTSS